MHCTETQETTGDTNNCVLALASNNSATNNLQERRPWEKLQAETKLIESSATPLCDRIGVDRGQCPKPAAKVNSRQGKKKRDKHTTRHPNAVNLDHRVDNMTNNSGILSNVSACAMDNISSGPVSELIPNEGRSKQKRRYTMETDEKTVQSEISNLMTCSPVDEDVLPVSVKSIPTEDLEMKNNVAGYCLSGGRKEATEECKKHILSESADISVKVEARSCRATLKSEKCLRPLNSDGIPVSAGKIKVESSLLESHDDDEGVTNDSSEMKFQKTCQRTCQIREVVKTYSRKRKKVYDYPMVVSKSFQEDTSSLAEENMKKSSSDHAVQMYSGDCSKDLNEKKLVEGVLEDLLLDKVDDGCTDVESLGMENERRTDIDNCKRKTTEGCLDKDVPLVHSAEQHFEQCERVKPDHVMGMQGDSRISHVAKEIDEESGKIVSDEYVDKHSLPSLSDLSNSRYATPQVDNYMNNSLGRSLIGSYGKKLLVLDINGLLADIVRVPHRCMPDAIISGKAVFKRPFCDDFLQFCFTRFSVGIWSSRTKRNVELILDFLMGDAKKKLLFCWDQYHCTETGFNTVENREKPLLVKKLKKLWEKYERNLPWERGEYNETNTLLIDDSPHKALGNPPHTAIFPYSYQYSDEDDNSLAGPGGALRVYLEGLGNAENVQKYVEENPFGQRPITEKNLSWRFYLKVIEAISSTSRDIPYRYSRENYHWRARDTPDRYSREHYHWRARDTLNRYSRENYHWRARDTPNTYSRENYHWQANR
ncbi:uncharacterized protein [Coffea arabica]|uniref:Uncharacterized protein isoform X1 n=1 Tax=Coffea arabica TaxID=13443 RepID=A0A6P6XGE6_COFAR